MLCCVHVVFHHHLSSVGHVTPASHQDGLTSSPESAAIQLPSGLELQSGLAARFSISCHDEFELVEFVSNCSPSALLLDPELQPNVYGISPDRELALSVDMVGVHGTVTQRRRLKPRDMRRIESTPVA